MSIPRKPFAIAGVALALFFALSASPAEAEARGRWRGGWAWRWPFFFHFHTHRPPPPPVPYYYGYGYDQGYRPAPPPPPPVAVQPAQAYYDPWPDMGFALTGLVETPHTGQLPLGGVAGALQFRTSSHSLLSLEVQSMGAHRLSDGLRRSDLDGVMAGRVFLWNAALAPYLELGGGLGRASMRQDDFEVRAVQLIGRLGLGLELRLGRHVVLDGQVAQVHRMTFDEAVDTGAFDPHERATVLRGGVSFRF
jgi:hypothetical protein